MTGAERLWAGLGAIAALSLLVVAAWLTPASSGHGTHEQLGLSACVWVVTVGKPCPTCGMTTAFSHAADADFRAAFIAQPFGSLLALLTSVGFWIAAHVALTGSTAGRFCLGLLTGRVAVLAIGALLAAWAYKIVTW